MGLSDTLVVGPVGVTVPKIVRFEEGSLMYIDVR